LRLLEFALRFFQLHFEPVHEILVCALALARARLIGFIKPLTLAVHLSQFLPQPRSLALRTLCEITRLLCRVLRRARRLLLLL
jgi:hypothetical protein